MNPMNFLVVEDNENMRRMICSLVSELAGETHECGDGAEAFTLYEKHKPDWVLMDIKMKEMDGITATRQIKAAYPEARIMIVTDYDDHELRGAAAEAGACEYVVKEDVLDVCHVLRAYAS